LSGIKAKISGVGMYVPNKVLTNRDLSTLVDTSDQWIRERTGISERRFVSEGESNSDLSVASIRKVLSKTGYGPEDIDLIIVATVTPDMAFPSTACVIQEKIGASNAWGFDLSAACSGFLYALSTGAQFIETGAYKRVLVVGTDVMSSIINFKDRSTCVLFGDGSGTVLLEPSTDDIGILDCLLHSDGSGGKHLCMPAGGSQRPATHETVNEELHYVHQDGRAVFRYAVKLMTSVCREILERNGLRPEDVQLFVPHQANARIIDSSVARLGLSPEQVLINIDRYANTTAATIPMGLAEAEAAGRLKSGDLVLLASFGAGFTWGSILVRWGS
jgi:3-oxoacyl-[acyl-carrier-protein] synthase-3